MNLIYHYTTVDALIGMTSNMSNANRNLTMWATDILCMNDPQERKVGVNLMDSFIKEIEEELEIPINCRISVLKSNQQYYSSLLNKIPKELSFSDYNAYITSFSKYGDSLPMWSMYAKNGNGISLGFDREALGKEHSINISYMGEVFYDNLPDKEIKTLLKSFYTYAYSILKSYSSLLEKVFNNNNIDEIISIDSYELYSLIIASFIKHHSYEYEGEIRFFCLNNQPMKFRSSNGFIVPYIDYKLPIDYLKKIIVGPTLDYERIIKPLISLFRSRGIDITKIEIEKSNIPYRG